jgi:hypothetical protein
MIKRIVTLLTVLILMSGYGFAEDYISLSDYVSRSTITVNTENAEILISYVNQLLTYIRASDVYVTSGARRRRDDYPNLHPRSNAIDLRYDSSLYNDIIDNISGFELRVECIHCIRYLDQDDHIHLDTGGRTGEPFHAIDSCGHSDFYD